MTRWLLLLLPVLAACGDKKDEEPAADNSTFLPVPGILRSQLKDIDTSVYSILKIETRNDKADTSYIKREEFKKYAADFLALPDLTDKKWKGDYDESNFFDNTLQKIVLTYTARDEDLENRKQELLVDQSPEGELIVKTIIAETITEKGSSLVRKNMIWHIDKRFQVITTTEKKDEPEKVEKLQVVWNYN